MFLLRCITKLYEYTALFLGWLSPKFCSEMGDLVTKLDMDSTSFSKRGMSLFNGLFFALHKYYLLIAKCYQSQLTLISSSCSYSECMFVITHINHPENGNHKLICDCHLRVSPNHPNLHRLYLFIVLVCVQCFLFFFASLIYYFVFICIPDKILRKEKKCLITFVSLVSGGYSLNCSWHFERV